MWHMQPDISTTFGAMLSELIATFSCRQVVARSCIPEATSSGIPLIASCGRDNSMRVIGYRRRQSAMNACMIVVGAHGWYWRRPLLHNRKDVMQHLTFRYSFNILDQAVWGIAMILVLPANQIFIDSI
jgi:hypothetical protein